MAPRFERTIIGRDGKVLFVPKVYTAQEAQPPTSETSAYNAMTVLQEWPLGTKMVEGERVWRYLKNSATAPAAGCPLQAAAAFHIDCDDDIAVGVAAAAGDKVVSITGSTNVTAIAADYYKEGYLIVNDAAGEGHSYKIRTHGVVTDGSQCLVYLYDPIVIALTTSSQVGLRKNPYDAVIACPGTTPTGIIVAVAPQLYTASYHGWGQTGGPCAVIAQAAIPVGAMVAAGTQAGKVASTAHDATYGIARTDQIIGWAMTPAVADTESFMVFLTLDR